MKRLVPPALGLAACLVAGAASAGPFSYLPPGDLIPGSGEGRADDTIYAPGMRFPIEEPPAFANSQVYNKGGSQGPAGGQCDASNFDYPWRDNYCEIRSWDMPLCPAGTGHQGQDIRAATCDPGVYWVDAVTDGTITNIGSYSVYLTAADGTRYDYLHMSDLQIVLGQEVKRGERIGRVSNQFNGTPTTTHLHFNIRQNVSGLGNVYVPPYTSLIGAYQVLLNAPPEGALEAATCDAIRGWTRDPDAPDAATLVRFTFDAPEGAPWITAHAFAADLPRDNECGSLGLCKHAFAVPPPLALFDGAPHEVHAYGSDTLGGADAELSDSPRTLSCALDIPDGVRRLVSIASMDAWRFSTFWDVAAVDDALIAELPPGRVLPEAPVLARADDGSPEVWLLDGGQRRAVESREVAAAWELELAGADILPARAIDAIPIGPPLRPRPFLVRGDKSPAIYLIDDPSEFYGADGPGADDEAALDCACGVAGTGAGAPSWALGLILLGAAIRRRAGRQRIAGHGA